MSRLSDVTQAAPAATGSVSKTTLDAKQKVDLLERIGMALARAVSYQEMADIITCECQVILGADAICTYVKRKDGFLEMISERGCTPDFIKRCRVIPTNMLPKAERLGAHGAFFFGPASDFKMNIPCVNDLVDRSGRELIGYAPLVVNGQSIGLIGFSFNSQKSNLADESFILTMVNLCAQALERARLSEQEKTMLRAAEEASRAKTEFLANISHEIRTPLGLIQGYTDLLVDSCPMTAEQQMWAAVIVRNTQALTGIVGEVLDIAQIESESLRINRVSFSLLEIIESVRSKIAVQAERKNLKFTYEQDTLPEAIYTDPMRLAQVMQSLLANALKFTAHGEVRMSIRFQEPNRLEIMVQDTGIGIEQSLQAKIFEPFTQVDASMRRRFGGTGLGLPISKHLAHALGGDLRLVDSRPGAGSTFLLWIHCEPTQVKRVSSANPQSDRAALTDVRILLVDDLQESAQEIAELLVRQGAHVDIVNSGMHAINEALTKSYDVILLDMRMPEMDGRETMLRLRIQNYGRPIIGLTVSALTNEREQDLLHGFDAYLTKPINPHVLISTIGRVVSSPTLNPKN